MKPQNAGSAQVPPPYIGNESFCRTNLIIFWNAEASPIIYSHKNKGQNWVELTDLTSLSKVSMIFEFSYIKKNTSPTSQASVKDALLCQDFKCVKIVPVQY